MIAHWVLTFRYWMKRRYGDTDKAEKPINVMKILSHAGN
jgi:hypothetical protein